MCWCGSNIAETVDCEEVARYAGTLPGVVVSRSYKYMCSDPGQRLVTDAIVEHGLTGVVVASCSPRMHEPTFRKAAATVGLNPYMLEMANIREHCSWVHTDRREATEKAKDLVRLLTEKVKRNVPLQEIDVPVTQRVMVIGAGIAGIQAALDVAAAGYEVALVERQPSIGGHMAMLDETFPTLDCSQCILTPRMVEVMQSENITLHSYAEVEQVDGYVGNFEVKLRKKARSVDMEKCTGCGDCWNNCLARNKITAPALPLPSDVTPDVAAQVDGVLERYMDPGGRLVGVLQDVQDIYNYLPAAALERVAEKLGFSRSHVYRVATFYSSFSLEERGRHVIRVCDGTACHLRGAVNLREEITRQLDIEPGETTPDKLFTLEMVACLGACALAPVMTVDSTYYGKLTAERVRQALDSYREREGSETAELEAVGASGGVG